MLHRAPAPAAVHAIAFRRKYAEPELKDWIGFWRIAVPACLLFWALIAYGIHSVV